MKWIVVSPILSNSWTGSRLCFPRLTLKSSSSTEAVSSVDGSALAMIHCTAVQFPVVSLNDKAGMVIMSEEGKEDKSRKEPVNKDVESLC
ncbi:hypothetical protein Nepgr_010002 [Nepenthes gracilis]|uniref:Uncharacterized protein n=1 Tax=Nepenthes gracilis TaxID=150966 RepID=A0AAD3SCG5_NEPGR|nr:hypothetical protein Nepgr_010002 [Nepenthes gracilis]